MKRGRPKRLYDRNEAIRLYRQGVGHRAIARHFGVGAETVRRTLLAAGVEMRRPGRPPQPAVDPVWGKLAYLMYRPRTREEMRRFELKAGEVRVDLGGESRAFRDADPPKVP